MFGFFFAGEEGGGGVFGGRGPSWADVAATARACMHYLPYLAPYSFYPNPTLLYFS